VIFFFASYFLIQKWREKVRISIMFSMLSLMKILALLSFLVSFSYLLGFFKSQILKSSRARLQSKKRMGGLSPYRLGYFSSTGSDHFVEKGRNDYESRSVE
jgi:hypothetical protein